uniref:Ribosomal protein eL8/eL30/eS12/Gadd45 domain-containing protein n=1 Tax=Timema tahoe TaxID=61484 RepID=A0A7R9IHW9_9NEOP|nr:unnamed protein product [Timema tahoe]
MAEAKARQFQRTSNFLTSTLKKDPTVVGSSLDIFEEGNSAPSPVEDTADRDVWVMGVTASTPGESWLLIQCFVPREGSRGESKTTECERSRAENGLNGERNLRVNYYTVPRVCVEMGPTKLSGAQSRKRKKQQEADNIVQAKQWQKLGWVKKVDPSTTALPLQQGIEISHLTGLKDALQDIRDTGIDVILDEASNICAATSLEIDCFFEEKRAKKRKRLTLEETYVVLTDSSQLTSDGFEKLPDQIMYPYAEPYDLQKNMSLAVVTSDSQNLDNTNLSENIIDKEMLNIRDIVVGSIPTTFNKELNVASISTDIVHDFDIDGIVKSLKSMFSPKSQLHSRKFREYCEHMLTPEINEAAEALIRELVRLQNRLYQRDPIKAQMKRRYVAGLRELKKYVSLKKLKLLIIAPDIDRIECKGGLDDTVNQLKESASIQNIPYVFALNRNKLGHLLLKKTPVSCLGVLRYEACEKKDKDEVVSPNIEENKSLEDVTDNLITSLLSKLLDKNATTTTCTSQSVLLGAIQRQNIKDSISSEN